MIDREKVIEAFTRCGTPGSCSDRCAYFAEGFNCYRAMKHDLLELLKEQQETIASLQGTICKLNAALQERPQWISVKDRLPEEHESIFYKLLGTPKWSNSMWKQESEKVLVYLSFPDGTGVVTTGCLHNSDWMTTVSKTLPQTVTHWMPLPEPPEVTQDA